MKTKYVEIVFRAGANIESAVKELKEQKEPSCGLFNDQMLYSDIDDVDSAYKKITGKTKAECDEVERQRQVDYEREKKEHEDSIPELTVEWIEKGKAILDKKHHELWTRCVPIRLNDLYGGMELGMTLDIVKKLNSGCEMKIAKEIIYGQGNSGMSFSLVCAMVKSFCDRGEQFVNYVRG